MELLSLNKSYFELQRLRYSPETLFLLDTIRSWHIVPSSHFSTVPDSLRQRIPHLCRIPEVSIKKGDSTSSPPLRIGVLLSGGQAPGGPNVVIGLFEGLRAFNRNTKLFGFIQGPLGLARGLYKDLDVSVIYDYYNAGGFQMLSSSREKIRTKEQKSTILANVKKLKLNGLLIIGGNGSNSDAALLAEYFLEHGCQLSVICVPKTIDGDFKNSWISTPLGFHTSCRTYTEMIGNLNKDAISTKKYHHFIRLMGRSASYTSLECGLQTLPNITLIGEHLTAQKMSLEGLSEQIAQWLVQRYHSGKNYGTLLIPEGLIEHLIDSKWLIEELNYLLPRENSIDSLQKTLSTESSRTLALFPKEISEQLLASRDSYGSLQTSHIAMEELLAHLVKKAIHTIDPSMNFNPVTHFFGYESRAGFPSNFDANYGIALGIIAALFLVKGLTGYMVSINQLAKDYSYWEGLGTPLYKMMHIKESLDTPMIKTEPVDLKSPAVRYLLSEQKTFLMNDLYQFPGPLQYFEESTVIDKRPLTLLWESGEISSPNELEQTNE